MRDLPSRMSSRLQLRLQRPHEYRAYLAHRRDSMVPRSRFVGHLHLARSVTASGDLVECGCWEGGMSAALAQVLPGRQSILFDSFQGLPGVSERDGRPEHEWMATMDRLVASPERARTAMERSGSTSFSIREGWFDDTVPTYAAEQRAIAVLRLDGDWYDSTMTCLENLYPLVAAGGVVLIDDYGTWEGCTRAVHDYLSRIGTGDAIQGTRADGVFIRREL